MTVERTSRRVTESRVERPLPNCAATTTLTSPQPYRSPELTPWGSIEELTLGPIFPNDDMDGTGSQPI